MIKKFNKFIEESYIGTDSFKSFTLGKNPKYLQKRERKFKIALEMEKRGKDPEVIRLATGWFKAPFDKKWRFEIGNYKIQINTFKYKDIGKTFEIKDYNIKIKLGNLIKHTSLFKEYPSLKNKIVFLLDNGGEKIGSGHYSRYDTSITINGVKNLSWEIREQENNIEVLKLRLAPNTLAQLPDTDRNGNPWDKNAYIENLKKQLKESENKIQYYKTDAPFFILYEEHISVLLHEIQHMIQYIEDFAKGGNPRNFEPKTVNNSKKLLKSLHKEFEDKYPEFKEIWEKIKDKKFENSDEYFADPEVNKYLELADKIGFTDRKFELKFSDDVLSPFDQYQLLAGEIESRDIQSRMRYPKQGGWGVYDKNEISKDDPFRGLYKSFPSETAALMHLQDLFSDFHNKNRKYVYNSDTHKRYYIEDLIIQEIPSRSTIKPFSSFTGDSDDVIINY